MKSLIFFLLVSTTLSAQSISTLAEQVRRDNPLLKGLQNEYLSALERAPQVRRLPDTELGIGAFPLPIETRLGPQALRLGATQMFPWFGTLERRAALEDAKALVAYERVQAETLQRLFSLRENYLDLYELRRSQAIIAEELRLLDARERLTLARVESGKASAAEVLLLQRDRSALEQRLRLLAEAETIPTVNINQLRHADLQTRVDITDSLTFAPLPFARDTLAAYLRDYHPELRLLREQQTVSRQAIELNRYAAKPDFGIGIDYIVVQPRENATINNNGRDILQLRATVRVPLSSQPYRAREREEELRIAAYGQRADHSLTNMLATVERAYSDHAAALLQRDYLQQQIEITATILRLLREQYRTGSGDLAELLRLESDLIGYRLELLQTVVATHRAENQILQFITSK